MAPKALLPPPFQHTHPPRWPRAGRLLRWLGLRASLSSMPLVCGASIALMLWRPTITTVALAELSRKIVGYALVRPAREVRGRRRRRARACWLACDTCAE